MKTYLFDGKGLYTGEYIAQESPLEPGVFIFPTSSTVIQPIISPGTYPVWNGSEWVNTEDHRGIIYNTANGEAIEHVELGQLPIGFTAIVPVDQFQTWQVDKWVYDINKYRASLSCTAYQFRAALTKIGLRDQVEAAVLSSPIDINDAWKFTTTFSRSNPKITQIAQAIGKADADIDALFVLAVTLNP